MKHICIFCACLLLSIGSKAQAEKGAITFGGNFLTSSVNSFDNNAAYEKSIQARIGFFATNHLATGLCVESGVEGNKTVPFSLAAFARWYTGSKTNRTIKFFVEAGAGVANYTANVTTETTTQANNWMKATAYVSPGINLFLCKAVALELAPEYRYIAIPTGCNRLGISGGIKFFLSEKTFKNAFPHTFVKSF